MIDEARLRAESAQLEHLLDELRELVPPPAWSRIEDVLRRVVALYGAGLAHALAHARSAGAAPVQLDRLVGDDELLASLLVLHGLHPLSAEDRIRRVLDDVQIRLALPAGAIELVAIVDGVAELHARAPGTGGLSAPSVLGMVRRALEAAAPELAEIRFTGHTTAPDPRLVQLRPRRQAP